MKAPSFLRPLNAKQRLHRAITHMRAPKVSERAPEDAFGPPVVAGLFSTPSGIGESARLCFAALDRLGKRPVAFDLSPRFDPVAALQTSIEPIAEMPAQAPLIIHLNPPELPYAASFMGAQAMQGRLVVGYWAWELPVMPTAWKSGFRYVHEIWVPSEFCASAIRNRTDKPVYVVPHPLRLRPVKPDRQGFGIPSDDLALLSICDLRSSVARKNLQGNIMAFRAAFPGPKRAILIIKLSGIEADVDLHARIRKDISDRDDIHVIDSTLAADRMAALYESVDGFLSLHRAEGFGLGVAEAMLRGKVAIATDWSGSRDFLSASCGLPIPYRLVPVTDPQGIYPSDGQEWAEPDIPAAATALQRWAQDSDLRLKLGAAATALAERYFSDTAYAQALSARFRRASLF
ncbi:mannosyltransferase [Ferrovibrio sp.]|uniref:mannosyltransferase n=1 Tax=Ferrovibrio sp. TaxID=1917215 RepID=UPI0035AFC0EB